MVRIPEIMNDFFTDTPDRIIGTETEFMIQDNAPLSLKAVQVVQPHLAFTSEVQPIYWLKNGGKLYYDMGHDDYTPLADGTQRMDADSLLEYATPECLGATQAALYEKAGEYIVERIMREMQPSKSHPVYKRTAFESVYIPNAGTVMTANSVGHHENYTTPTFDPTFHGGKIPAFTSRPVAELVSYLATRPIWAGAGIVSCDGFRIAQKFNGNQFINGGSGIVHGKKGAVMLNKDQRGAPSVEVRCGDGNMLLQVIRRKLAMTSLVLRLIEHQQFPPSALISNGLTRDMAAQYAALNPNYRYADNNGYDKSSVAHQRIIALAALDFAEHYDVPTEETIAATEVLAVCNLVEQWKPRTCPSDELARETDWGAKLSTIHQQLGCIDHLSTANLQAVMADLEWESLGDNAPSTPYSDGVTTDQLVTLLDTPPRTRAELRSSIVSSRGNRIASVTWNKVFIKGIEPTELLSSPYLSTY